LAVLLVSAMLVGACGADERGLDPADRDDQQLVRGLDLFQRRCSGCHTLSAAGAQGAAINVSRREPRDGPNFDRRSVTFDDALFAIRNGGFGGNRMPANIVRGADAEAVARYLERYAGRED
jgi:mono/diheme cytochrome c family protein